MALALGRAVGLVLKLQSTTSAGCVWVDERLRQEVPIILSRSRSESELIGGWRIAEPQRRVLCVAVGCARLTLRLTRGERSDIARPLHATTTTIITTLRTTTLRTMTTGTPAALTADPWNVSGWSAYVAECRAARRHGGEPALEAARCAYEQLLARFPSSV